MDLAKNLVQVLSFILIFREKNIIMNNFKKLAKIKPFNFKPVIRVK